MNLKFRRQHVIAPYIVDLYCHELGLIVELDGSQHATKDGQAYDFERTQFLEAMDLKVIRYWNNDILANIETTLVDLWNICDELSRQ